MSDGFSAVKSITSDLFKIQMKWTLSFFSVVLVVFLLLDASWFFTRQAPDVTLAAFIFEPSKIYMLVIGIVPWFAYFTYFISHGVTRKDYFAGTAISAALLAVGLMGLTFAVSGLIHMIEPITGYAPIGTEQSLALISSHPAAQLTGTMIVLFLYYLAGWIVAIGFYRFHISGGFASIAIVIILLSITDAIWAQGNVIVIDWFRHIQPLIDTAALPFTVLVGLSLILAGAALTALWLSTRRTPVKMG
ncbi:hypothetical protein B0H94_105121 [Salsuginibacillus halophilus]|uniref:Uncharacterized protein n=1 Tax=Salsuginibacillus halophilus TaxID=517424 RepID=A0A2P8HL76_9BACI|nr:hypothetical protein [Salsuginibacillus halophilus]PSL46968.1 hypothetical protein B0H94_105121 [Salsuginibacillus halophilus]